MEEEIGTELADDCGDGTRLADVLEVMIEACLKVELLEERGVRIWNEGNAGYGGAEIKEPLGKPCALEAGVAGDEDTTAAKEPAERLGIA